MTVDDYIEALPEPLRGAAAVKKLLPSIGEHLSLPIID